MTDKPDNTTSNPLAEFIDPRTRYRHADTGDRCIYCGGVATTDNHVPAPSYADQYEDGQHWKYPACAVCVQILGPLPETCIHDRRGFIADMHDLNEHKAILVLHQFQHFPSKRRGGPTDWHRQAIAASEAFRQTVPNVLDWKGCKCGDCNRTNWGGGYFAAYVLDYDYPGWDQCYIGGDNFDDEVLEDITAPKPS